MPEQPLEITQSKLLLVEGPDDERFFTALLRRLHLNGIQILAFTGKDNLRNFLPALVRATGFEQHANTIIVVRDADLDAQAAFQSVCSSLKKAGLPEPSAPLQMASAGGCTTAVVILPCMQKAGMLENVCLSSVQGDPAMRCVERFLECLSELKLPCQNPAKARVQAFLASREEPGKRLGEAAEAGYWRWDAPAFAELTAFLKAIF
jgi:hypothetical protein